VSATVASAPAVRVEGVEQVFKRRGREVQALAPTDLTVGEHEFVTLLGPSGCGKSTLFKVVAGLVRPTAGRVYLQGRETVAKRGEVAYMPQTDNLLPWRNVLDNAILALEVDGVPKAEARREATELLERFGLGDFLKAHPTELSGGMRQRVALIRTVLFRRDVLLLDEPLGALDSQTRLLLQEWLLDVWSAARKAVLFITHDVDEAVYLSDRVYVMSARPGHIIDEVPVDLPRPRGADVRLTPEFGELRARLLVEMHAETQTAMRQAQS
jgi:ABC-type nitrate/sulfonate/bicarbonate transport system ATPase subunit